MQRGVSADMKCEFYEKCSFADPESSTCTQDDGGKYCGQYRVLKAELSAQPTSSELAADKQPSGQSPGKTPC